MTLPCIFHTWNKGIEKLQEMANLLGNFREKLSIYLKSDLSNHVLYQDLLNASFELIKPSVLLPTLSVTQVYACICEEFVKLRDQCFQHMYTSLTVDKVSISASQYDYYKTRVDKVCRATYRLAAYYYRERFNETCSRFNHLSGQMSPEDFRAHIEYYLPTKTNNLEAILVSVWRHIHWNGNGKPFYELNTLLYIKSPEPVLVDSSAQGTE